MSTLRVDNLRSRTGTAVSITEGNSMIVGGGVTVTGALDVTGSGSINATGAAVTFNAGTFTTLNATTITDTKVGGALTITGNLEVQGTQTIINTQTLDVEDKTVGVASTSNASNTTASGAGLEIYASSSTANNNKTILWQNDSNAFEYSDPIRLPGVQETAIANGSTGIQTYIDGTSLVLDMDLEKATVFTYTSPTVAAAAQAGGIGIVSFKNMPADAQNVQTVTLVHTQGKGTAGYGNTLAVQGIGLTCTVIPKSGGNAVAGISTRAFQAGGGHSPGNTAGLTTAVCSADYGSAGNVSGEIDLLSFMVHYTGGTNTALSSYKIYVTANKGFNQGSKGV